MELLSCPTDAGTKRESILESCRNIHGGGSWSGGIDGVGGGHSVRAFFRIIIWIAEHFVLIVFVQNLMRFVLRLRPTKQIFEILLRFVINLNYFESTIILQSSILIERLTVYKPEKHMKHRSIYMHLKTLLLWQHRTLRTMWYKLRATEHFVNLRAENLRPVSSRCSIRTSF